MKLDLFNTDSLFSCWYKKVKLNKNLIDLQFSGLFQFRVNVDNEFSDKIGLLNRTGR